MSTGKEIDELLRSEMSRMERRRKEFTKTAIRHGIGIAILTAIAVALQFTI